MLSLVPLLVARRLPAPERPDTNLAMLAGLLGGVGVVAAGAVLSLRERYLLPAEVRTDQGFTLFFFNMYVALAVAGQAVVAFVVASRIAAGRPALALFSALLTALVAASGVRFVVGVARCSALFGRATPTCLPQHNAYLDTQLVHWIVVKGPNAAIVASGLAIALRSMPRRRRPAPSVKAKRSAPWELLNQIITVVTVVVLVVAAIEQIRASTSCGSTGAPERPAVRVVGPGRGVVWVPAGAWACGAWVYPQHHIGSSGGGWCEPLPGDRSTALARVGDWQVRQPVMDVLLVGDAPELGELCFVDAPLHPDVDHPNQVDEQLNEGVGDLGKPAPAQHRQQHQHRRRAVVTAVGLGRARASVGRASGRGGTCTQPGRCATGG